MSKRTAGEETRAGIPDMSESGPVTVSIARRVRPGKEAQYEDWVRRVVAVASTFPGHLGVNVLKPSPGTGGEYVVLVRFDSYAHQKAWEDSEQRAQFHRELDELTEGEDVVTKVSGLEFWFSLPEVPAQAAPSQHKMALVLCVVVFVLVLLTNVLFGEQLAHLPLILRVAVLAVVQVLLLTYVVMPRVTALLKRWLYGLPK